MIKIKVIAIGKDKNKWVTEGQAHFTKLLSRFAKLESIYIPSPKLSPSLTPLEIKKKEAELFEKQIGKSKFIALIDSGIYYNSIAFSRQLEKLISTSAGQLIFLIGGAYGLDEKLLSKASFKLSLSPLTFSHQLVRLVLFEQLYRAFSISNNTDYHK